MSADIVQGLTNDIRTLKINGHVGFDTLPYQLVNKAVNQGFSFNILCIGDTGLGKSTLMETLFEQNFDFTPSAHDLPDVSLKVLNYDMKEGNVKLKLSLIESCGFGDQINKEDCINPIIKYVDGEFEKYLQEEMKIKRSLHTYCDSRVHVCLYFITPSGHTLKSLDLVAMKKLDSKVNIIPIIAKSDTITKSEIQKFKSKIMREIQANKINIYQFPTTDETIKELNSQMNQMLPFAVVGSNDEAKLPNGKTSRVRQYPWGTVQIDNETHCDFNRLREMLLRTNMDDLRERTHAVLYETYRKQRLIEMGFNDSDKMSLQETYEQRRETQTKELKQKEEEIRQMFFLRVKEKENHLKEADKELLAKFENVKKNQAEEKRKLEERRRILEDDIATFEKRKAIVEQAKMGTTMKKKK